MRSDPILCFKYSAHCLTRRSCARACPQRVSPALRVYLDRGDEAAALAQLRTSLDTIAQICGIRVIVPLLVSAPLPDLPTRCATCARALASCAPSSSRSSARRRPSCPPSWPPPSAPRHPLQPARQSQPPRPKYFKLHFF